MGKSIRVVIGKTGDVSLELSGYEGGTCADDERRLRDAMAALGLSLTVEDIVRKSPERVRNETRAGGRGTGEVGV